MTPQNKRRRTLIQIRIQILTPTQTRIPTQTPIPIQIPIQRLRRSPKPAITAFLS